MALVIKKSVDLSSLGSEYEGIELVFKSIPAQELGKLNEKQEKLSDNLAEQLKFFVEILSTQFLSGSQAGESLVKEDIESLDSESLILCFRVITGQDIDPKQKNESTSTSTTESAEV